MILHIIFLCNWLDWGIIMRVVNLRIHQFRKLKGLVLKKEILNTEALMLILDKKYAKTKDGGKMLF